MFFSWFFLFFHGFSCFFMFFLKGVFKVGCLPPLTKNRFKTGDDGIKLIKIVHEGTNQVPTRSTRVSTCFDSWLFLRQLILDISKLIQYFQSRISIRQSLVFHGPDLTNTFASGKNFEVVWQEPKADFQKQLGLQKESPRSILGLQGLLPCAFWSFSCTSRSPKSIPMKPLVYRFNMLVIPFAASLLANT